MATSPPVQETSIGPLPARWKLTTVAELFTAQQGKAVSKAAREGDDHAPFLRTANVFWGRLRLDELDRMHFSERHRAKLALRTGDLLVCEGGDIGRTAIWTGEVPGCFYQNHVHRLRLKNPAAGDVPEFFMHWMRTAILQRHLYVSAGNNTTIPNLSKARLSSFTIPHPPAEEQRAIAAALSAVRTAAAARRRGAELERERKAAVLQDLIQAGLGDGWNTKPLQEVYQFRRKPRGRKPAGDAPVQFVPMKVIPDDGLNISGFDHRPAETIAGTYFEDGDLLLASITPSFENGKQAIVRDLERGWAYATTEVIPIQETDGGDIRFLAHYLRLPSVRNSLAFKMEGSTNRQRLKKKTLARERIVAPPARVQREIAGAMDAADDQIAALSREADLHDELFRALLDELMTGRRSARPLIPTLPPEEEQP